MKKLAAVLLTVVMLFSVAYADPDLSELTYDQLIALQQYITAEIMSRPEWKETTVPSGQWVVGVDIPVGTYCIKPTGSGAYITIKTDKGRLVTCGGIRQSEDAIGKITLNEGYTVEIEDGKLIFTPAITLGF